MPAAGRFGEGSERYHSRKRPVSGRLGRRPHGQVLEDSSVRTLFDSLLVTLKRAHARCCHLQAGKLCEEPQAIPSLRSWPGENQLAIGMPSRADQADILLFGGDGTIHRHLSQYAKVKLGLPVLVVPTGSGNDFARALGLRRVRDALTAWRRFCAGQENVCVLDLEIVTPAEDAGGRPRTSAISQRSARR